MAAIDGPGTVTGPRPRAHGAFGKLIRLLLKFTGHLVEPFGDRAVRAHACEPKAAFDLLAKVTGIRHS